MGGRGRAVRQDRWSWIAELSDQRLENYGRMSVASYRKGDSLSFDNRRSLNYWLSVEYESRFGRSPSWRIEN